ncbi:MULTISPECIES: DNA-directed RNA polymerase subunit epsilon [Sporosarcina]|uniref:DNA-directed RNA polymerase subunit epsilon n=1 Tax=Sporosarcina contaminans TaxID=633403 RepID=A0ABW3U5B4_9BACL
MIYKVYYQENPNQVPVRETTKSLYIEADSEKSVREKLKNRNYNIELIQVLEGEHLEYEKSSAQFELVQD